MNWIQQLQKLSADVDFIPPASLAVIDEAERALGGVPPELKELLKITNGLVCRSFRLFSVFDHTRTKKTWDSLQRANDTEKTNALGGDKDLLSRFLVFADIGNGFAVWDRTDGTIWFEENGSQDLVQTDLSLREFVELMVINAV